MSDEMMQLRQLLHKKDSEEQILEILKKYHPYDLAKSFSELNDQERQVVYELLTKEDLADIFSYLEEEDAARFLQEMSYAQGADVLTEMAPDDAADVLNELEEVSPDEYLTQMEPSEAENLKNLAIQEEDSAGSIMSTDFIKIKSGLDVKEATRILGYEAHDAETIDPLFVVDENDKLLGIVSLQTLITARTPLSVNDIMDENFIYGLISDDDVNISKKIRDYDIYALPILDEEGIIKGIVTMDDALDVATEEIAEDYSKMAAVNTEETSIVKNILGRLPWLIILLAISLLISNITARFEDVISKVTVLWFFNTMILDMAGNTGTQNLAVAVRRIGRGEVGKGKHTFRYILKEFITTFINAILLGVLSFGVTYLFINILHFNEGINPLYASLVIALSLCGALVLTGMLGTFIPLLMNFIHIDPALASGPLITTLNDIIAMIIYFGLASIMMPLIVL